MSEYTQLFERAAARYPEPELSTDRLLLRDERKQRNRRVAAGVLGIAVFALAAIGFVRLLGSESTPAGEPRSPFEGTWVSTTDADGGTQTMTVRVFAYGAVEIVVTDDVATVCGGTSSTMTGTGRIEDGTRLVIPAPVYTCDDGSEPQALSGPPLEEQLRDLTFILDAEADTLTDNLGGVWVREGSEDRSTTEDALADLEPLWPQTSLEEVRQAQERADAGDPRYTWQIDPDLAAMTNGEDAEIVTRFLQEKLGWGKFRWAVGGHGGEYGEGTFESVFIRCAPGRTNPLYPNDPAGGGCAPTIDQFRYETVKIKVAQLGVQGPSGIWVVARWEMLPPSDKPMTYGEESFTQRQIEQVAPPSHAEATTLVEAFLQARVDGEGAEEYLPSPTDAEGIPLLYATTSGAPYERSEFRLVEGPVWPIGRMEFEVRLFADGGKTVVEQPFVLDRAAGGSLGISYYSLTEFPVATNENGEPVSVPYEFLDGEVTFAAAPPWDYSIAGWEHGPTMTTLRGNHDGRLALLADPRPIETGCVKGPTPDDAEALARSILSDPDLEATDPVTVRIAGIEALRMDVVAATSGNLCVEVGVPEVVAGGTATGLEPGHRMRLYLLDYPGGSARVLAIAIAAPEDRFESVLEAAAPILDSFEFHPR